MSDLRIIRDEDPEVVADLRLRAATERDPSRSREMPEYKPAKIIGVVPCRGRCGATVDWPEEAEHAFSVWNRILEKRNEAPLDKTKIVFCNACRDQGKKIASTHNRKHIESLAEKIREMRDSSNPENEHELIKKLDALHHPDISGLIQSIRNRLDGGKGRRVTKGGI